MRRCNRKHIWTVARQKHKDKALNMHSTEKHTTLLSLPFSLFFAPLGSLNCCEHPCFVRAPTDGPGLWHSSQYVLHAHTNTSFWPSTHSMCAVAKGLVSYCKAPPPEGAPRLLFNNSRLVAYLSWCVLQRVLRPDPRMILSKKNPKSACTAYKNDLFWLSACRMVRSTILCCSHTRRV